MEVEHLLLQTKTGDTALCLAAAAGNVKMAKIMVAKNKNLLTIRGSEGLVPLCVAAFYGNGDMVRYLYKKSNRMEGSEWKASTKQWLLLKCVEFDLFGKICIHIYIHTHTIKTCLNKRCWNLLQMLHLKYWKTIQTSLKMGLYSEFWLKSLMHFTNNKHITFGESSSQVSIPHLARYIYHIGVLKSSILL